MVLLYCQCAQKLAANASWIDDDSSEYSNSEEAHRDDPHDAFADDVFELFIIDDGKLQWRCLL